MRAHIAPSSCSRSLALRFVRPPTSDQCCIYSLTAASRSGFSVREARGSGRRARIEITPIQQRVQCRSYKTGYSPPKTPPRVAPLSNYSDFLMPNYLHHSTRGRGPEAGSMVAGKRRATGGLIDLLFRRKSKKYTQRQENVSSRYLDSGAEEAILGRSLLHKNNGDEFLRCTEFDKEGSRVLH